MFNIFSTRELAIAIWSFVLLLILLLHNDIRKSLSNLLRAAFACKLQVIFYILCIYIAACIYVLNHTTISAHISVKNILLWFFFTGIPFVFSANTNLSRDGYYFSKILQDNIKLAIVLDFIINYYTFDLWFEMLLVPTTAIIAIIAFLSEHYQMRTIHFIVNCIILLLGTIMCSYAVYSLVQSYPEWIKISNFIDITMPLALSIIFTPLAYLIVIITTYEIIFIRIDHFLKGSSKWDIFLYKINLIKTCKFSYQALQLFNRHYSYKLSSSMQSKDLHNLMEDLSTAIKSKDFSKPTDNIQ